MKTISRFRGEYEFLSNFYPCRVTLDGLEYASVEHAYVAAKSLDPEFRERIRNTMSPGLAKRMGRTVVVREDWDDVKLRIMSDLLKQKFECLDLQRKLVATDGYFLVEGNNWGDIFWGVDDTKGGKNFLGVLLMNIRDDLVRDPKLFIY